MRFSFSRAQGPAQTPAPGAGAARAQEAALDALDGLERWSALDGAIGAVQRVVQGLPLGRSRDVLHGVQLGHPLHPALIQAPLGCWLSAAVLDIVPGAGRGARVLMGTGVLTALPAVLAGWVDWAELHEQQKRTGFVHAAATASAVALCAGSWYVRGRRRPVLGRALGWAGLTAAGAGGLIGGHLAYRQAAGANKTEPVPHLVEPGWHPLGRVEEFPVGEPVRRALGEVPVLVVRTAGGTVHVLAERCSHLSGPLSEGEVADGCVRCPWHGSLFRLADGRNVGGPATAPQPSFEARVEEDGAVSVRLPGAG